MRFGFGYDGARQAFGGDKVLGGDPVEDVFCKCTEVYMNVGTGKVSPKLMNFPANCNVTTKIYNNDGGAQIGVTRVTAFTGTPCTATGVTVSAGTSINVKYTTDTSEPGFKDVTAETVMFSVVVPGTAGDYGPYTPADPVG